MVITPLAYNSLRPEIATFLIDNGADIYCRSLFGDMMLAYYCYDMVISKILLERGMDMYAKNKLGISAYNKVIKDCEPGIIELFEQYNWLDIKEPCVD